MGPAKRILCLAQAYQLGDLGLSIDLVAGDPLLGLPLEGNNLNDALCLSNKHVLIVDPQYLVHALLAFDWMQRLSVGCIYEHLLYSSDYKLVVHYGRTEGIELAYLLVTRPAVGW